MANLILNLFEERQLRRAALLPIGTARGVVQDLLFDLFLWPVVGCVPRLLVSGPHDSVVFGVVSANSLENQKGLVDDFVFVPLCPDRRQHWVCQSSREQ